MLRHASSAVLAVMAIAVVCLLIGGGDWAEDTDHMDGGAAVVEPAATAPAGCVEPKAGEALSSPEASGDWKPPFCWKPPSPGCKDRIHGPLGPEARCKIQSNNPCAMCKKDSDCM